MIHDRLIQFLDRTIVHPAVHLSLAIVMIDNMRL